VDKSAECGIDVAVRELVAVLRANGRCAAERRFANTPAGHKEVKRWLTRSAARVRVCLESTGLYGLDVALYLQADSRLEVMVANPRSVKDFARALLRRSKSDPLDAWVLAEYAGRMPFRPWQPPGSAALAVTALARRIHALTEAATREKNRLHALSVTATSLKILVTELKRSVQWIERSQARLTRQAHKIIAGDVQLARRFQLLLSLPGVAETSALQLLGELARRPDVIALAYHVDYWDRLGWPDRFSLPAATLRQRAYSHSLALSGIYTPQMVVDGKRDRVGRDADRRSPDGWEDQAER